MQLVRFGMSGEARIGVLRGDRVHDLASLVPDAPQDMVAVIGQGRALLDRIAAAGSGEGLPLGSVVLLPPIEWPGKFVCMGLNYAEHVKEGGADRALPEHPTLFLRVASSLLAPGGDIVLPRASDRLDYEAELLVVIGNSCRDIDESAALDVVYGYTAFNDGSIRDFQRHTTQWTAGKNFDATGPFGPAIVTTDELPAGAVGLSVRTRLNGAVMQDGNTRDMIFPIARIISYVSRIMTLEPGDVIATGTPSGVGFARNPPVFMKPGDEVSVEIEGLSPLVNRVIAQ